MSVDAKGNSVRCSCLGFWGLGLGFFFFVKYLVPVNFLTHILHTVSVVGLGLWDGCFLFTWQPESAGNYLTKLEKIKHQQNQNKQTRPKQFLLVISGS